MKTKPPCKDCEDRSSTCHAECKRYAEYVKKHEGEKRVIREARGGDYIYDKLKRGQKELGK